MITKTLRPDILTGYATAVLLHALAIYVGGRVGDTLGLYLMLGLAAASVVLVAGATFRWGRLAGYPVMTEAGSFSLQSLLRNLAMTALVLPLLAILAAPVWGLVFWSLVKK